MTLKILMDHSQKENHKSCHWDGTVTFQKVHFECKWCKMVP